MYIRRIETFIGRNNENLSNTLFITKMFRHDLDQNYKYAMNRHTSYPYYYESSSSNFNLFGEHVYDVIICLSFESLSSYDAP